jgi:hypothetical protein
MWKLPLGKLGYKCLRYDVYSKVSLIIVDIYLILRRADCPPNPGRNAIGTWYESWYPRVAEANGRRFEHELDDVLENGFFLLA